MESLSYKSSNDFLALVACTSCTLGIGTLRTEYTSRAGYATPAFNALISSPSVSHLLVSPHPEMSLDGASNSELLHDRLNAVLSSRAYPKTACPSEVARGLTAEDIDNLGYQHWRDAMEPLRQLIQNLRSAGEIEVLQRGEVIDDDVTVENIKGPIRIREPSKSTH